MSILAQTMPDLSEMREAFAQHPAALEAAAEMNSQATGLRPQCSDRQPILSRPVRIPSHNARISGFLAFRQAAQSVLGKSLSVAEPRRLVFRSVLGVRQTEEGFAINLEFVYHSDRGCSYDVTGFAVGCEAGRLSGEGWARACTCPDFQKRHGPGRDQLQGEARCCKHMRLLLAVIESWQGQAPWIGGVPAEYQLPGEPFQLRCF